MRVLSVMIFLATLILPSAHAAASPPSDISIADLQTLHTQADQGEAKAQNNLGLLYYNARGVPQDYAKAREWFEKAAAQGYADAQYNLGVLYDFGLGVPQNYAVAREWFEKAAAQQHVRAQTNLGVVFQNGQSIARDYARAYMWYSLAAAHSPGDAQRFAANNRDKVARRMTPAQVVEAQRLTQQCRAQQFKGC